MIEPIQTEPQPMTFSVTEIMMWLRCRRQHQLQSLNALSLEPLLPRPYFALGSAIHKALEKWKLAPQSDLNALYASVIADVIIDRTALYESRIGAKPSPKEMAPILEYLTLGAAMMNNYQTKYKTPLDPNTTLISAEQTVTVPIPNSPHFLEGTFDALIRLKNNHIVPLDHKTYNTHPSPDMMYRSFQFLGYQWMASQLNLGHCPGIAYDGLWARDGSDPKHTTDKLFHREIIYRTTSELKEFEQNLPVLVNEMASPDSHHIHHIPWNGCYGCGVQPLCSQISKGETPTYDNFSKRAATRVYDEPI